MRRLNNLFKSKTVIGLYLFCGWAMFGLSAYISFDQDEVIKHLHTENKTQQEVIDKQHQALRIQDAGLQRCNEAHARCLDGVTHFYLRLKRCQRERDSI